MAPVEKDLKYAGSPGSGSIESITRCPWES